MKRKEILFMIFDIFMMLNDDRVKQEKLVCFSLTCISMAEAAALALIM